jgi:hypothetical protein
MLDQRRADDLTWLSLYLKRRVNECDLLTALEHGQLADMLIAIRDGWGACKPLIQHRQVRNPSRGGTSNKE